MDQLRYSILGAGAMGSVFGARLHLAGFKVELLNRTAAHSEAIKAKGLLVNLDGKQHRIDIAACTVEHARPADVVIIFTKSYQIESALQQIASSGAAQTWLYHASGQTTNIADRVGADFNQAGITTSVTPDVQHFIWQKACFNVAMNALCALTSGSPGLLDAHADGDKVHELIDFACANHTWHKPSMVQDLDHEGMTEIDALNGSDTFMIFIPALTIG